MKLLLVDDDDTLLETIEDVQDYNLEKSLGRLALTDEIVVAIGRARKTVPPAVSLCEDACAGGHLEGCPNAHLADTP